ncbi:hypothetical protein [Kitasatospora purpeofusca]|uniref:hypothetical protein n=1 Tax=Kitasatospora purpeofusca TaxID=67352 RepID=UPI0036D28149
MTTTTRPSSTAPRSRRRLLIGVLAAFFVLSAAGVAGLYRLDYEFRHPKPDSGRPGAWMTVGSEEVSRFAHVAVPTAAADVRWAYRNGFQDDFAVLAFRLPQAELDDFRGSLPVTGWAERKYSDNGVLSGFLHAGAPDPSHVFPLACGSFYSPGPAKRIGTSVCFAGQADGTNQLWISAMHTP